MLEEYSLSDLWSEKFPNSHRGTFHRGTYSARLDYWMVPSHQVARASIKILPHPLSDHCIVTVEISLSSDKRGPGYWRFNNSLLNDPTFVSEMRTFLDETVAEAEGDPNIQWEWVKFKIRSFSIEYSIKKKRERNRLIKQLQDRLNSLATEFDLSTSPDIAAETTSIKCQLGKILQSKASAAIFYSKARWSMYGERPTSYFLGLEKRQSRDNTVTALIDDTGQIVTQNTAILNMERDYFTNIYKEDPTSLRHIEELPLSGDNVPRISDLNHQRINRPFSEEELFSSLKELNKGKVPGSDGITPEFYVTFWETIKHNLIESIFYSIDQGRMSDQQRSGIINLMPKKGLDRRHLANWRPITLLNTDLKIMSKAHLIW